MTRRSSWRNKAGRKISFTGLGLLFVCFFLPQVRACNMPLVPADEAFGSGTDDPQFDMLATLFLPFVMALVMAAFYLLRAALRSAKVRRVLTGAICLLALLTVLYGAVGLTVAYADDNWHRWTDPDAHYEWDDEDTLFAVALPTMLAIAATATLLVIRARRPVKSPAALGCMGGLFAAYFLLFTFLHPPMYGIWISITASGLIAIGGLSEAIAARRK